MTHKACGQFERFFSRGIIAAERAGFGLLALQGLLVQARFAPERANGPSNARPLAPGPRISRRVPSG